MATSKRDLQLEVLGLVPYQQNGISLEQVNKLVSPESSGEKGNSQLTDIPWIMLERLMRNDYRCRENKTVQPILNTKKKEVAKKGSFHPMDLFLLVFTSCDILLRQVLVKKMANCRLSIPFIIPYSDGTLEVSLWPLRSIAVEWMSNNKSMEVSLVKHPFKIISFFRLRNTSMSKSQIINESLSDKKETFFNKQSGAGNRKRDYSNGLVEMTYCLPKGETDDAKVEAIVMNLRGDGLEYSKQLEVLNSLSSVMVCCCEVGSLKEDSVFQFLLKFTGPDSVLVVILCGEDTDNDVTDKLEKHSIKVVPSYDDMACAEASLSDLADLVTEELMAALPSSKKQCKSLLEQKDVLRHHKVQVDEDRHATCGSSEKEVNLLLKELESKKTDARVQLLPLQGEHLYAWGKLLKRKHRSIKGYSAEITQQEKDKIATDMLECRQQQLHQSTPLRHMMQKFIELLQTARPPLGDRAFLKRLKIELDDISRSILPELRQKYLDTWQTNRKDKQAVAKAEKDLLDSSFGPEHLFREMGQLYECLVESEMTLNDQQQELVTKLPVMAAKAFLSGHSLEIMDGDAGVVPLSWVQAIFDSLQTLIGDKKMFVLAVVGVQSSGKSTLLNAMFGLELAVGAGRCTRGVYAQLLPIDKTASDLVVDYVLVIDSEGLCGTMTDDKEHDNEIATLVIGLADLTLVNVKGENTQQMKDIFEIAVHAFLRMKAVNEWKKQKCIFLHQSVASAGAKSQLMHDRHMLQDHLDDITKQAAEIEGMSGYINKFSNVIDFDCERNVMYIPDLWNGVPPLAQVSNGYSDKIKEIRNVIVAEVEMSECSVTAKGMHQRLKDIWNGVLADDFLFSFKNNVSIQAYLSLEKEFYELVRYAESTLLEFTNKSGRNAIENCTSDASLDQIFNTEKSSLRKKQNEVMEDCKIKLKNFFTASKFKEALVQWQHSKEMALQAAIEEIRHQLESDLKYYKDMKHFELSKISINKQDIVKRAKDLSNTLRGKKYDNSKLMKEFNALWNDWEKKLKTKLSDELKPLKVKDEMSKAIHKLFETIGHTKFLGDFEKVWMSSDEMKSEEIQIADMKKEYLAIKSPPEETPQGPRVWKGTDIKQKEKSRANFFKEIVEYANKFLEEVKTMLGTMEAEHIRFVPKLAHDILQFIVNAVDTHNAKPYGESVVTLTPPFKAMVTIHVARIATKRFEKLDEKFQQTLSLEAKMKIFKDQLQTLFVNAANEKFQAAAEAVLCNTLKQKVEDHIQNDISRKAVDRILEKIQFSKHTLQVQSLTHLANKKSFNEYMLYINDVKAYSGKWVEEESKKILFDNVNSSSKSEYMTFVEEYLKEYFETTVASILKGIQNATAVAKDQEYSMTQFVSQLKAEIEDIKVLTDTDYDQLEYSNITDFDAFQKSISEAITKIQNEILKRYKKVTKATVVWQQPTPYQQVMDKLWGCKETCPLCLAPCMYTTENHVTKDNTDHRCLQHWPNGLGGSRWKHSQKLTTQTCNFLISTESQFHCGASRNKCRESGNCVLKDEKQDYTYHPHKQYKEYIQHWNIEEDAADTATKYWKWVMKEYKNDLTKKHKTNPPDIPKEWTKIKKDQAVESLSELSPDDCTDSK